MFAGWRSIVGGVLMLLALPSWGQCVNTMNPTCGVYTSCFAHLCKCDGSPYEYFKSYGARYCAVFLDLPGLSAKGKAWRNSTLKCLQEKIVPLLPKDGQAGACNCKQMQVDAFDSHVACYTQPSASICALDAADWSRILAATDPVKSLMDQRSRKQMLEVARICVVDPAAGQAKATIQKVIDALK
jgi:hypothetical protein